MYTKALPAKIPPKGIKLWNILGFARLRSCPIPIPMPIPSSSRWLGSNPYFLRPAMANQLLPFPIYILFSISRKDLCTYLPWLWGFLSWGICLISCSPAKCPPYFSPGGLCVCLSHECHYAPFGRGSWICQPHSGHNFLAPHPKGVKVRMRIRMGIREFCKLCARKWMKLP